MKRYYRLIAALLMVFILVGCGAKEPPTRITIVTDATFPPFEDVDNQKRELVGFDIDLMKAVAEKANLEVDFSSVRFNKLLTDMAECNYDGAISAITVNDERKQQMIFSTPYLTAGQVVVVKKGNSTITGKDKLTGMMVGVQSNSTGEVEAQKIEGIQLTAYPSFDQAFSYLDNGLIDAVIADKPMAASYINEGYYDLKIVGSEFAKEDYAIGVCSQNKDLLKKINNAIWLARLDGTIDRLTKEWIYIKDEY